MKKDGIIIWEAKEEKVKVVLQDGMKDCGVCCLLSIIRFYGGEVPKERLRELTNTTKEGVSLYNLLEAAEKMGFTSQGVSATLEDIEDTNLPCIAHIETNKRKHFVVIYKIRTKKKEVVLMDPAKGKKTISFAEYHLLSTNHYLLLKPKKTIPIMKKKNVIYHQLKKEYQENKKIFLFIIFLTINCFLLNIITSFHFKYLLEYAINYHVTDNILPICLFLLGAYLFRNSMNSLRNLLLNKWSCLFTLEITTSTYRQILLLPYLYFKNRTTGEVLSRFQDLGQIRDYIASFFTTVTLDVFSSIAFFLVMLKYEKKLTNIINLFLGLLLIITIIEEKKKKQKLKKVKEREDNANSYLVQGISNVDTIKGSHLEKRFIDKFDLNFKALEEHTYQYTKECEKESYQKRIINDLLYLVIFALGTYTVILEKMTLGTLILFETLSRYYISSFTNILYLISNYPSYKITLDRIEELFMIEEEKFQNNYFYLPYLLEGDIILKGITYEIGSKQILQDVHLKIKKGEKILLSGESGSGKSTLMKMLMRYIEVPYGCIEIAKIDINHYHLQNIRANITYVTGNEYLFQDSVKNNICLYQEYEKEEIEEVCKICFVEEMLKSKNMTLDSIIEENGFNLSSGERQRIILARSLLRKTSIYILDEALGQVDIQREKKILENVFSYLKEKTIIVISHRFHNKKQFDRILKLEKGVIYENEKL